MRTLSASPRRRPAAASLLVALPLVALSACATAPRRLDERLPWHADHRQRLDAVIAAHGKASAGYSPSRKPFATFDWDNTCIRNDAGDATLFWMLQHDKVRQPPGRDWKATSRFLTDGAARALSAACDALAEPGAPLPTSSHEPCATEIVTVYDRGKTTAGEEAFAGWDHRRMEPRYAWATQLEAGWTGDDVRGFARAAREENLARPVGAQQSVGKLDGLEGYVRYYDTIHDLIGTLQQNGIDVWIVSASSQFVAEPFAAGHGVPADHVVGVRSLLDGNGRITYHLEGCGDVKDGEDGVITYIDGKRCFINKVIQGDRTAAAMQQNPDPARRQILTGGDSDTDITFLRDATAAHLVIDRHRPEVMCFAHANADGRWLVEPMWIEPFAPQAEPYPCATSACKASDGTPGPCRGDDGAVIPDQPAPAVAAPQH